MYRNTEDQFGLSFAWIKSDFLVRTLGAFDPEVLTRDTFLVDRGSAHIAFRRMAFGVLNNDKIDPIYVATDPDYHYTSYEGRLSQFVTDVYNSDVVISNSPPKDRSIKSILSSSSSVAIGTLIGIGAADGSPYLMFLTVPAGVLVMGTVVGVSKGLEQGLGRAVKRMIDRGPK